MEGIPIRGARRGDIPSLLLLWTAMLKENAKLDGRLEIHPHAKEHMAQLFSVWIQDPERQVVVAEENGRVVIGYAAGRVVPGTGWHKPLRLGEITDCFVVSPRRRQGIARRMVGRLTDLLYELDTDTVRCRVVAANPGALAFWRSMGWEILEEVLEKDPPSSHV
ncbi:MAG: N-acetyltransferase family protein [Planctomycetota bacterium]